MARVLGGFQCSKYTLMGLNVFYIIVGIILISLGTKWINSNQVTNLPIIGGVVACGVFLILISVMGIFGAIRHHQVLLFFYMIILFVVFIIQFSVACASLAVSDKTQASLAESGWDSISNSSREHIQNEFQCCKFNMDPIHAYPPKCPKQCTTNGTTGNEQQGPCPVCERQILDMIGKGFQIVGGVSLFFSFTEIIGAFAAYRYRNMYGGITTATSSLT